MKSAIVVFPGSNCDRDVQVALRQAMGSEPIMIWHKDSELPEVDLIVLPGGFSYGDYLRCGAMSAHAPAMRATVEAAAKGVAVLGICNGFQILTEAGLLPGALARNRDLKFHCRDVHLRVETGQSLFTSRFQEGQCLRIPVANRDGCYLADEDGCRRLEDNGQIAFRYSDETGSVRPEVNLNGSVSSIAGIFNEQKTVLGLMPHPERLSDPALGGDDGRAFFDGLVEALS
ncbi:MAG: phosphoribosylformylglycinamidine synthase subunit PurQ [Rhodospirillales bacterium]|nr:phosphoribosylformylglycinamidine synthase subunit PurQ [Rhodospirillales bacterium]